MVTGAMVRIAEQAGEVVKTAEQRAVARSFLGHPHPTSLHRRELRVDSGAKQPGPNPGHGLREIKRPVSAMEKSQPSCGLLVDHETSHGFVAAGVAARSVRPLAGRRRPVRRREIDQLVGDAGVALDWKWR
jgi:hypothetical protein